jgi:glycerol uptake facilitator-like aquaporin
LQPAAARRALQRESHGSVFDPAYLLAQVAGAFAGVAVAHIMFEEPALFFASKHERSGPSQLVSEFVATFGLLCVIWALVRAERSGSTSSKRTSQ